MLLMIPTLFGVAVLCFFMLRMMPGDPVQMMMDGANVSKAVLEAERALANNLAAELGLEDARTQELIATIDQLVRMAN